MIKQPEISFISHPIMIMNFQRKNYLKKLKRRGYTDFEELLYIKNLTLKENLEVLHKRHH